jgi:cyclopropane fatty-acyl-phospholipid synthase-like methyltransferase
MWNQRYGVAEYVYGAEPNLFLVEHAQKLRGPVLSLAEGEGRNAVFLASLGLEVLGVDGSEARLAKAEALAAARGVPIQTQVADLAEVVPREQHYGAVVAIFAHLPSAVRHQLYPRVARCLKPGGLILLESYAEARRYRDTGGTKDLGLLMTPAKVAEEFPHFEPLLLQEVERDVCESRYHRGLAVVVQFIGKKKS